MEEATLPEYSPKPAAAEPRDAKPATVEPQDSTPAAAELQDANLPTDQLPVERVTPLHQLGDQPQWIDCPFCQHRAMTRLDHRRTPMQL